MRMTNLFKLTVLGLLGITVACSLAPQVEADIEQATKDVSALKQEAAVPDTPVPDDVVRVKNDIWLGDTSKVEFEGEQVPSYLEAKDGITLISNRPITLFEIGNMISKITSLSVRYAPELEDTDDIKGVADENAPSLETIGAQWTDSTKMLVNYKGPLSGLLDEVANRFGVWWKYEKNEVYFYRYITKTFVIYSLPTNPSLSVNLDVSGSGGSGEGASGGATINQQNQSGDLDMWSQIQETLDSMITESGSISVNRANGTVTVTDTPANIRRIAKYVNETNDRLSKQVAISVKVFSVTLNDEDKYGFDLNELVYRNGAERVTRITADGSSGVSGHGLSMLVSSKHWDINAAIKAISTQKKGKLVTSGTVSTMNNKPAPIQVVQTGHYNKNMQTTTTTGSDNTDSSTDVEDYTTGFMMSVLPRILDHGRLMLFFNLSLSEVIQWEEIEYSAGQPPLRVPKIETRGFTQEVALKSGQTLVLAGYERAQDAASKEGTGSPDNMLLGGKNEASMDRNVFVIMLTPVVLETPLSPESRMSD